MSTSSLFDILRSLNRRDTPYNRRKLEAFRAEWLHDKDYAPHNREQWNRFAKDRWVKGYLD